VKSNDAKDRPLARALERPRAIPGGPVDPEDRIVADILCVNCSAKIRGQYLTENCYQCGHPNTDSVYGDLLVYSEDKTAVTHLHESALVVIYSAMFTGVLGLIIMLMPMLSATGAIDVIARAFDGITFAVLVFPLVAFVGMLLLTRHRSLNYFAERYANVAFLVRAAIFLIVAVAAIGLAARYVGPALRVVAFLVWTMLPPIMFFRGLAGLLKRVPNLPLAAWCNFLIAGIVLLGLGGVGVAFMAPLANQSAEWEGPVVALKAITVLATIGWSIGAFAILRATKRTLEVVGM
jgi:hypothetical protein